MNVRFGIWVLMAAGWAFGLRAADAPTQPTAAAAPLAGAASEVSANFKQLRVGKAVVSLPANWTSLGVDVPLWIHLHGAPATVEKNFAEIGAPGVLVNITLPGLSKVYADHFADAAVFPQLLQDVEGALRAESAAQTWRAGRVTVSSFSAGFGGVRQLFQQPAAYEKIATLVMADSIYCGYTGDPKEKRVDPVLMAGFLKFATAAAEGQKRMLITHTRQVPEGYASTTETADYLLTELKGERMVDTVEWAGGLKLLTSFTRGQLDILGFDGEGAEDHMAHLRRMGAFYERVAPVGPARGATTVAELQAQLNAHVTQPRFASALWSVKVASLETGRVLFEHHPDRLQSPASNSKLYTGAMALDRLGSDYRIRTPILAAAKPDAAGTLAGDLVVSGRGDPSLRSPPKRAEFWKIFAPFVDAVAAAGVKRIRGDVVADATYFRGTPNGSGWTADDLNDYYGAEISAVTLEDNYVELRVGPGATAGQAAELTWLQPHSGLVLDNRAVTTAKGSTRRLSIQRLIGENVVHVFGEIPLGSTATTEDVTVPRPAGWFAGALKEALEKRGIVVEGRARGVRWPDDAPLGKDAVMLGEVASPPMRELVKDFMKPSQNLETDLIFGHVGETTRTESTPALRTSETLGVGALRDFLKKAGVPLEQVRFEEGSGLSRNNLTTATATARLLAYMATHPAAEDFYVAMPIAGVDGTLRRRMKGTPAENNVRAKTGTLRWANGLSGYVTTAAGEKLVFSVLLNRAVVPAGRQARDDVDAIAVMLARYAGPRGEAAAVGSGAAPAMTAKP